MSDMMDDRQPLLRVDGLSVRFGGADGPGTGGGLPDGGVRAVSGVSWELRPGRVTALVGESGSGKSVSAMTVLGLLAPTAHVSGSVRLTLPGQEPGTAGNEVELVGAGPEAFRALRGRVVSLVSQEPMGAWNPVQTIGTQVTEALQAHRGRRGGSGAPARLTRTQASVRVAELLRDAGLDEAERIAASYPHQLSGGQLQRALIAMALSQDPEVVVADEPTTALDVTIQAGILGLLRRLRDERGAAILLITHDMGVVADLADDVVVMREGQVVEHAAVAEIFGAPSHAYTKALLDAVPHLSAAAGPGAPVPSLSAVAGHGPARDGVVVLERVGVVYGRRHGRAAVVAADAVDLQIAAGEVLGLVGESGSGKSTLGQVVAGLARPTSGRVLVDGADLARASRSQLAERRRRTGVVFQDPASTLNPRWSVGRCVAEPLALHTSLGATARRERVLELLGLVRLSPEHAGRYPHELSGGQRQRVAIARAVALGPRVLVADEPTSALDVSVQAYVLEVFRDLQERLGFACLFVSHDLAVIELVAQRVAVMQRGRIVEQGTTAQVLRAAHHEYTQRLLAAAPVADPLVQAERRADRAAVA